MIADNKFMLAQFRAADDILYFPACLDLTLTGPDWKVRDIRYFIKSESAPLDDYLCVKTYSDSYVIVYAATRDTALLTECFSHIAENMRDIAEIELRTPYGEIFSCECFRRFFAVTEAADASDPVYFIHSHTELADITPDSAVSVSLASEADRAEIADEVRLGHLKPDEIGPDIFNQIPVFRDTRLYLLRVSGKIAGFLRAECGYSNIYSIGWIYVLPAFRGHGYAVHLTLAFARDCYDSGRIPHYGFAVSKESERVAEKCGFKRDMTPLFCNMLRLR